MVIIVIINANLEITINLGNIPIQLLLRFIDMHQSFVSILLFYEFHLFLWEWKSTIIVHSNVTAEVVKGFRIHQF